MNPCNPNVVCVDFDGVLNTYHGYKGKYEHGVPRDGAKEFLETLSKQYQVAIFTCAEIVIVRDWLVKYDMMKYVWDITSCKLPAIAYIDDRGIRFNGDYNDVLSQLKDNRPYWKVREEE